MSEFLSEQDTRHVIRTKTEIFYNSAGTKTKTIPVDGNRSHRQDSMSADSALNDICSLIHDVHTTNAE